MPGIKNTVLPRKALAPRGPQLSPRAASSLGLLKEVPKTLPKTIKDLPPGLAKDLAEEGLLLAPSRPQALPLSAREGRLVPSQEAPRRGLTGEAPFYESRDLRYGCHHETLVASFLLQGWSFLQPATSKEAKKASFTYSCLKKRYHLSRGFFLGLFGLLGLALIALGLLFLPSLGHGLGLLVALSTWAFLTWQASAWAKSLQAILDRPLLPKRLFVAYAALLSRMPRQVPAYRLPQDRLLLPGHAGPLASRVFFLCDALASSGGFASTRIPSSRQERPSHKTLRQLLAIASEEALKDLYGQALVLEEALKQGEEAQEELLKEKEALAKEVASFEEVFAWARRLGVLEHGEAREEK